MRIVSPEYPQQNSSKTANFAYDFEHEHHSTRARRCGLGSDLHRHRRIVFLSQQKRAVELAADSRLPVVYHQREYVDAGGSISYGVSVADFARRAATYVDKLLKGTKPADLSVEQPTKFELVINLKTASQIGLNIPPNVLAQADRVIR
jgi:ABC transporter substrate binding protein